MQNKLMVLGIIALAVIIGFSVIACDNSGGGADGNLTLKIKNTTSEPTSHIYIKEYPTDYNPTPPLLYDEDDVILSGTTKNINLTGLTNFDGYYRLTVWAEFVSIPRDRSSWTINVNQSTQIIELEE